MVTITRDHPVYNTANIASIEGEVDERGDYRGEGRLTYTNGDYEARGL